jgi:hypothetical protein
VRLPRFRLRTLMIAVAVVAITLASIAPGRQWYRRWSYHRAEAARFAMMEARERTSHARELQAAADREAVRQGLLTSPGFANRPTDEQERIVDNVVESHRRFAAQCLAAARSWAEKRKDSELASFWAFDPLAPNVP